jgi:hypothetical protein
MAYTPPKGVWTPYNMGQMGDYWNPQTSAQTGFWDMDPNVNYGQSPGENFGPVFNDQGSLTGWREKGNTWSPGGSGLFGDFGDQRSFQEYNIDPATGQLMAPTNASITPSMSGATNFMSYAMPIAMMAGLGAGAAGGAFGGAGAAGSGSGAIPGMNAAGGWGVMDASLMAPGAFEAAMGGTMAAIPGTEAAMGASPYTVAGDGMKVGSAAGGGLTGGGTSVGGASSQMPSWMGTAGKVAGAAGSLFGGGSGTGSGLGGLLGAGLGYLDAKSQPDSLTIRNEIDPRLAQYAYGANGAGGIAGAASNLMNQQLNGPNPLADAGKQISGMANTLPSYNDAVANNKSLWDANPWITEQQNAITNKTTQNLLQNVMPNIGSQANAMGGYGGSRQGIAQGLAMSNMNTDLAPALAGLASNAWENSQNRAMSGANSQLNYGLQNQLQQAGLLGTGANLQQQGAWAPIQNATNVMGALPGNSSRTEPLFSNPWAGAIGGASLGSQVGGGTDWGGLFKGISGLFGGGSGNTPPVQNDFWNSSNLYPWLKG